MEESNLKRSPQFSTVKHVLRSHRDVLTTNPETARQYEARNGEEFVLDFGDKEGPYHYLGRITTDAAGVQYFSAKNAELHAKTDDESLIYRVHLFVNEAGNGYGVVQKKKKSDAPVIEEKEIDDQWQGS